MKDEVERIVKFIQETFARTGKKIAVIGLSGGVDSATSFLLTVKALGKDRVIPYYLPAKNSNPQNLVDIKILLAKAGLDESKLQIIPIKGMVQKGWRVIKKFQLPMTNVQTNQKVQINKLRIANLQVRMRMIILYDQAKKWDGLVVGTENKSEELLGYFTRFGDEASDIEPIIHLYKTQVIELAKDLGVPTAIVSKPPSADLWQGQTDERELGFSYAEADKVLQNQVEGVDTKVVAAVRERVAAVAFKHQVPYCLTSEI